MDIVGKTVAAFLGAIVFAKISAAKCFAWCMGVGIALTAAILLVGSPVAFLACVFIVALMTANSFGMCMGLALDKVPEKTNEITALMVMAIVGGRLAALADAAISVPETETYKIQELHLPVYHALCAALEEQLF